MRNPHIIYITSLLLLLWDQYTKYIFFDKSRLSHRQLLEPAFNTWVSWSLQIPMEIIILIAGISICAFVLAYQKKYFNRIVFSFLIAGTLWNMIDRLWLGWVRDFISIWSWFPIFNVADIYLNIGIIIFLYLEFFAWKAKPKS